MVALLLMIGCSPAPRFTSMPSSTRHENPAIETKQDAPENTDPGFGKKPDVTESSISAEPSAVQPEPINGSSTTLMGKATFYGREFHGKKTASGERYDMHDFTAAHKSLPFNTILLVTNLDNRETVRVRVNDRGPFIKGIDIDLSYAAAKKIGMISSGHAPVSMEIIDSVENAQ